MTSWRWWLSWGAVPLWGCLLVLLWTLGSAWTSREWERELARLRREGVPLRGAELSSRGSPDQYEAGRELLRALDRIGGSFQGTGRDRTAPFPYRWHQAGELSPAAEAWVARNRSALDVLARVLDAKDPRLPVGGFTGRENPSGRWTLWRGLALLACAARLAHESGRPEECERWIVRLLCYTQVARRLPLDAGAGSIEWSRTLDVLDSYVSARGTIGPTLRACLAGTDPFACRSETRARLDPERALQFEVIALPEHRTGSTAFLEGLFVWSPPMRPFVRYQLLRYSLQVDRVKEALSRERWDAPPRVEQDPARSLLYLYRAFGWSVEEAARHAVEVDARLSLFRATAQAIDLRGRSGGGSDEEKRPCDPFTGQPLKVVRDGRALVVYSVGPDRRDDGGKDGVDLALRLPIP